MMYRITALLVSFLPATAWAEAPRVATDILPVHALVSRVMEGVGVPDLILPPNVSPHGHAMRPSEAADLQSADLLVWIGPELTPWLERARETVAARTVSLELLEVDGTVLHLFEEAAEEESADAGHDHDHDHHHGDGHDHGDGVDPHAWLDPENGRIWLAAVAATLSELDPENAATYAANAAAGQAEILALESEIDQLLSPVRGVPYLTFHDAYGYFEDRFGLTSAGSIRLGDAAAPGAAHVQELRETVARLGVICVFAEPQFPSDLAATVVEGSAATIATIDPIGTLQSPGAGLYANLLRGMAADLSGCLGR